MKRAIHVMGAVLMVQVLWGQPPSTASKEFLQLDGRVRVIGGTEEYVNVLAMRDGVAIDFTPKDVKKMELRLQLRRTYVLSFQNYGYLTKDLLFDTYVPFEDAGHAPFSFPFDVILEPQPKDSTVRYAGPVGVIYYSEEEHDFVFIKDYTMIRDKATRDRVKKAIEQQAEFVAKVRKTWAQIEAEIKRAPEVRKDISRTEQVVTEKQLSEQVDGTRAPAPQLNELILPLDTLLDIEPLDLPEPKAEALYRALEQDLSEPDPEGIEGGAIDTEQVDELPKHKPDTVYKPIYATTKPIAEVLPDGRTEELIQEKLRISLVITITKNGNTTRYKRVANAYGPVFYFENERCITQQQYQLATGRPN